MVGDVDRSALRTWVEAYERAWRTPGSENLATLFAEDATYRTAPFEEPFRGLGAISAMWEDGRDGHDEAFELESQVVAVEGDVGVVSPRSPLRGAGLPDLPRPMACPPRR